MFPDDSLIGSRVSVLERNLAKRDIAKLTRFCWMETGMGQWWVGFYLRNFWMPTSLYLLLALHLTHHHFRNISGYYLIQCICFFASIFWCCFPSSLHLCSPLLSQQTISTMFYHLFLSPWRRFWHKIWDFTKPVYWIFLAAVLRIWRDKC